MSSTETGAIFGNVVYETTGASERSVVRSPRPARAADARWMALVLCRSQGCLASCQRHHVLGDVPLLTTTPCL